MPKTVLTDDADKRVEYHRADHDESGEVAIRTTYKDDSIAEKNKAARNARTVETGKRLPFRDKREVVYLFKILPAQWALFKRSHPQIAAGLHSKDHLVREKAAADVKEMHPEWVVAAPRGTR